MCPKGWIRGMIFALGNIFFYVSKMRDTQLDESVRIVHVFMH